MQVQSDDIVVAYAKMKQAALYFKYVVPIPSLLIEDALLTAIELDLGGTEWQVPVLSLLQEELSASGTAWNRLIPPHLANDPTFVRFLSRFSIWDAINSAFHSGIHAFGPSDAFAESKDALVEFGKKLLGVNLLHDRSLDVTYDALMDRYALKDLPAVVPDEWAISNVALDSSAIRSGFRLALIDV